jgi:phospholipase C
VPAHYADGKNGPFTMGYYEEQDIPFQRALAQAFTICDNYAPNISAWRRKNLMRPAMGRAQKDPGADGADFPGGG